jgi:thiol-disulfide isomerase/thioredoxin
MKTKLKKSNTSVMMLVILTILTYVPNIIFAQNQIDNDHFKPVEFGVDLPEELWDLNFQVLNHPTGRDSIKLADFKGKLIILDFWATYCSSCLLNFPKLKEIQNNFPEDLKLLAVTIQKKSDIEKFFKSNIGKDYDYVNTVVDGAIFKKFFPHNGIPHVVWILPNGKYLTATRAEDVTSTNIKAALANVATKLRIKIDLDRNKPLFITDNFYVNEGMEVKFSSFFSKGQYPGYPSGNKIKRNSKKKVFGRQMTNVTLVEILHTLAGHLFEQRKGKFTDKHFLIQSQNPLLANGGHYEEGNYSDLYCYELIVPEDKADFLYSYMLQDLNRYLDFDLLIEDVNTDCYVIIRKSNLDKMKTKGGKTEQNYNESDMHFELVNGQMETFISILNELPITDKIIIDETGYNGKIDLKLNGMNSMDNIKKELNNFDLDLISVKRKIPIFVVRDK